MKSSNISLKVKMKILFIIPKISDTFFKQFYELSEPWRGERQLRRDLKKHERSAKRVFYGLGLLVMASCLDPDHHIIDLIDENFEEVDFKESHDLVALTGQIIHHRRIEELIGLFGKKGVHVVVGGIQATLYPEEFVRQGVSVIVGEGESLFKEFIDDFMHGSPKPVYQRRKTQNIDLDTSPLPHYPLVSRYRYSLIGVETTRGCPYDCEYCNVTNLLGSRYRHKSVRRIVREVRQVRSLWQDSMFFFYDDNLFADTRFALELFESLQGIGLNSYGAHADISLYKNQRLLRLMSALGRPNVAIGFETLSLKNAPFINNRMKTSMVPYYQEAVDELRRNGIEITGSFMFGFEGDSERELEQMLDFVEKNGINAYFTIYSATPKSALFSRLLKEYESRNGKVHLRGFKLSKLINDYLVWSTGFAPHECETVALNSLKNYYPDLVPMQRLEGLAVSRLYRNPELC